MKKISKTDSFRDLHYVSVEIQSSVDCTHYFISFCCSCLDFSMTHIHGYLNMHSVTVVQHRCQIRKVITRANTAINSWCLIIPPREYSINKTFNMNKINMALTNYVSYNPRCVGLANVACGVISRTKN